MVPATRRAKLAKKLKMRQLIFKLLRAISEALLIMNLIFLKVCRTILVTFLSPCNTHVKKIEYLGEN